MDIFLSALIAVFTLGVIYSVYEEIVRRLRKRRGIDEKGKGY